MINGKKNKKSGVLVITLPTTNCTNYTVTHQNEKDIVYPGYTNWTTINTRKEYEERYPYLPDRIIDNLLNPEAKISVVNWKKIIHRPEAISFLIEATHNDKNICKYDLSRKMRRYNS